MDKLAVTGTYGKQHIPRSKGVRFRPKADIFMDYGFCNLRALSLFTKMAADEGFKPSYAGIKILFLSLATPHNLADPLVLVY